MQMPWPAVEYRLDDRAVALHVRNQHGYIGLFQIAVFSEIVQDAVINRFDLAVNSRTGDDLNGTILRNVSLWRFVPTEQAVLQAGQNSLGGLSRRAAGASLL